MSVSLTRHFMKLTHVHDTSIGNVVTQHNDDREPGLGVTEGFDHLVLLPPVVLDTSGITPNAVDGLDLISIRQEPGVRR